MEYSYTSKVNGTKSVFLDDLANLIARLNNKDDTIQSTTRLADYEKTV